MSMVQDVVIWKLELNKEMRIVITDYKAIVIMTVRTNQQYLSFTYRKYLGVDCKTIKENVATKTTIRVDEDVWSS